MGTKIKKNYDLEEKDLKKRLESLERKYGGDDFSEVGVDKSVAKLLEQKPVYESHVIEKPKKGIKLKEIPIVQSKFEEQLRGGRYEEKRFVSGETKPELKKKLEFPFNKSKKEKPVLKLKFKRGLKGESRPSEAEVRKFSETIKKMKNEISKVLIGQEEIVDGMIRGLLCDGHVLLEGVPGVAKTLAIRALGAVSGCDVKRIQFTVDLLPTDITGITSYTPEKGFEVIKGPIFTNFLIADEINRAPSKTQSALIEGMQERQVTIGRKTYEITSPFFVMATENPLESAGVYPLPEAQIDRFLFKLIMGYPKKEEERIIMSTNITLQKFEDFKLKAIISPEEIIKMQNITKRIYLDEAIESYILEIVEKTRNKEFQDSEYLNYGVSPRGAIGMFIASKSKALMDGRNYVIPEDVKFVVFEILRHRLILSYKAVLKKISADDLIKNILNEIRV